MAAASASMASEIASVTTRLGKNGHRVMAATPAISPPMSHPSSICPVAPGELVAAMKNGSRTGTTAFDRNPRATDSNVTTMPSTSAATTCSQIWLCNSTPSMSVTSPAATTTMIEVKRSRRGPEKSEVSKVVITAKEARKPARGYPAHMNPPRTRGSTSATRSPRPTARLRTNAETSIARKALDIGGGLLPARAAESATVAVVLRGGLSPGSAAVASLMGDQRVLRWYCDATGPDCPTYLELSSGWP